MRLPLVPPIDTRDGTTDKDGHCRNMLFEQDEQGQFAVLRPSINIVAAANGNGRGIVEFQDELISVYGATLGELIIPPRFGYGTRSITYESDYYTTATTHISYSGDIHVGYGLPLSTSPKLQAWFWTDATRMRFIDSGGVTAQAYGVSDDLRVIGVYEYSPGVFRPFTWTEDAGLSQLSGFSGSYSSLNHVSPNGEYFTAGSGTAKGHHITGYQATAITSLRIANDGTSAGVTSGKTFKIETWAGAVTTVTLSVGTSAYGLAISGDGTTVCGVLSYSGANRKLFIWDAVNGEQIVGYSGGYLTNLALTSNCISEDGQTITGTFFTGGMDVAFRYNNGVVTILDVFGETGSDSVQSSSISPDGSRIAGVYYSDVDPLNPIYGYFSWDAVIGVQVIPDIENGNQYPEPGLEVRLSNDGFNVAMTMFNQDSNGMSAAWQPDIGKVRSLATLEDQFFDFVQSTI